MFAVASWGVDRDRVSRSLKSEQVGSDRRVNNDAGALFPTATEQIPIFELILIEPDGEFLDLATLQPLRQTVLAFVFGIAVPRMSRKV